MTEARKVGDTLDSLGVTAQLDEGDMVTNAVVLLKVVQEDGSVGLVVARDEAATWMDEFLLIKLANREADHAELSRIAGED